MQLYRLGQDTSLNLVPTLWVMVGHIGGPWWGQCEGGIVGGWAYIEHGPDLVSYPRHNSTEQNSTV